MTSRGAFLASGLATVAAGALTAPAPAAGALTTVRVSGPPDFDVVTLIWGQRSGLFARYGLDLQLQRLDSGSAVLAAVVGGSFDLGKSGAFQLIQGYLKGVPILLESVSATYSAHNASAGFVVAQNSGMTGARDLTGKTVAVPSLGSQLEYVISDWIDRSGGDSRNVKFVPLPEGTTSLAISAGRVDGATLVEPYLSEAVEAEHLKIIGRPYDAIANYFGVSWYFAGRDYAAKNADVLARFRRGLAEATTYVLAHKAQMIPLITEYTGSSRTSLEKILPSLTLGTGADPALLQPIIDFTARVKMIPSVFRASELIDPTALNAR